ncbi:MAG TPA: hypothetical protein VMM36_10435 [Opitutaceae bacterium]|nr:hypothetical protein [Opitutaceae bacterium]
MSVPDDVPTQITSELVPWGDFVSAAVLAMKAKQFDDGLYATVELMAHRGKRDLVQKLITSLDVEGETTALLGAAQMVAGEDVHEPLRSRAEPIARAFLADEQSSKPIGFYTWSEELRGIFQQDRLLQANVVEHRDLARVAHVIHAQPELRATYDSALQLAERLTNPLSDFDLRPWLRALDEGAFYEPPAFPAKLALLPPSVAHETELGKKLYGDKPIPPGFDLMNELIACIRAGTVSLKPTDSSGWYDWQTWSLETLVAPDRGAESARLHLDDSYARHLVEMFKGAHTLTRETHIKQLEIDKFGAAGGREQAVVKIIVRPKLRVEPLVTHYTRRAEAYRFVRSVLDEAFGAHVLAAKRRIREDGMAALPLGEELAWMERLFGEAAMAAEQDLGMRNDGDVSTFTTWASTLKDDIDVAQDARAMVPVFFDILRGKIKAWLFMGWNIGWMTASFRRPPLVTLLDPSNAKIVFEPARFLLATPVMEEAYVSRILDRREFRQLCDLHGTPEKIIAALQ